MLRGWSCRSGPHVALDLAGDEISGDPQNYHCAANRKQFERHRFAADQSEKKPQKRRRPGCAPLHRGVRNEWSEKHGDDEGPKEDPRGRWFRTAPPPPGYRHDDHAEQSPKSRCNNEPVHAIDGMAEISTAAFARQ